MFFLCMLMDVIAMFAVEKQPSIAQLVERWTVVIRCKMQGIHRSLVQLRLEGEY
jgi:hypothetical protein